MGFIQAFTGSLGGMLADQWIDFFMVPEGLTATTAITPAIRHQKDAGRGQNFSHSENVITDGSKIIVPENWAAVTLENGMITGFLAQPGGYIFKSGPDSSGENGSVHSASLFTGGGVMDSLIKNTFERIKYGGIPSDQQLAFYVNLKEIPNLKFGTQSEVYWDDAFLNTQVGAITRGSYTLKIIDPILMIKEFVPAPYLIQNAPPFDFSDINNDAANQLFNEVIGSLTQAFSIYSNEPGKNHRINDLQNDMVGFAKSLAAAVEANYQWESGRGLKILTATLLAIEYDEGTKKLLEDVKAADALMGARMISFRSQAQARGIQDAGSNEGGGMMGVAAMGMNMAAMNAVDGAQQPYAVPGQMYQQPQYPQQQFMPGQPMPAQAAGVVAGVQGVPQGMPAPTGAPVAGAPAAPVAGAVGDQYDELTRLKSLLDAGVITQADFDAKKAQILGL